MALCELNCEVKNLLDIMNYVHYYIIDMDKWTPTRIKELRQSLKLTQQTFGAMIGVTREYVNKLESEVRKPGKTMQILFDCIEEKKKKNENGKEVMRHGTKDKRSL
jgi:DNA-binding transcriptional regulator YiaG